MWFLYVVVGWCSFVGLAVMVVLAPVPTRMATLTNDVQKQKMKATDARVQEVTESEIDAFEALYVRILTILMPSSDERFAYDQALWMGESYQNVRR